MIWSKGSIVWNRVALVLMCAISPGTDLQITVIAFVMCFHNSFNIWKILTLFTFSKVFIHSLLLKINHGSFVIMLDEFLDEVCLQLVAEATKTNVM